MINEITLTTLEKYAELQDKHIDLLQKYIEVLTQLENHDVALKKHQVTIEELTKQLEHKNEYVTVTTPERHYWTSIVKSLQTLVSTAFHEGNNREWEEFFKEHENLLKENNSYKPDTYDADMCQMFGDMMIAFKELRNNYGADRITEKEFVSELRDLMHEALIKWEKRVFTKESTEE